jgi:hypothetical protein
MFAIVPLIIVTDDVTDFENDSTFDPNKVVTRDRHSAVSHLISESTFTLPTCLISCLSVKPLLFNPPKKLVEVQISGPGRVYQGTVLSQGTLQDCSSGTV